MHGVLRLLRLLTNILCIKDNSLLKQPMKQSDDKGKICV